MESQAILFTEQEKVFVERTGKDFSTLYKKYYPKLIYFTSKMCNDAQTAEDISTDSFMTAFEKIDKYEKVKAQFSTWLFTIAKNLALQNIKNGTFGYCELCGNEIGKKRIQAYPTATHCIECKTTFEAKGRWRQRRTARARASFAVHCRAPPRLCS